VLVVATATIPGPEERGCGHRVGVLTLQGLEEFIKGPSEGANHVCWKMEIKGEMG
jgi:hypothetical protein